MRARHRRDATRSACRLADAQGDQPADIAADTDDARPPPPPPAQPDARPHYLFGKGLTISTWNARALLTPDPDMHHRRCQHLVRLAARSQVVCIQGAHSDDGTMRDAAARIRPTHFASHSAGPQSDTGGVMTFMCHELADADSMQHTILLPGRVTITSVRTWRGSQLHIVNVHNHDVPAATRRTLRTHMKEVAGVRPPEYIFSAGDWNFTSDTGGAGTITTVRGDTTTRRADGMRRAWRATLHETTEVGHELPTRAAEVLLDDGTRAVTMSSLDRLYTTAPPYVLAEVATTVEVGKLGAALPSPRRAPLSDHVYVRTTMRLRPSLPPHVRPIPPWITRHPLYKQDVRRRLDAMHMEALHPHDALRRTKQAIRSAAAATRDRCLRRRPTTPEEFTQLGLQLARALARGDMAMVNKATRKWPAARAALCTTDGVTTITDRDAMTRLIGQAIADPTALATGGHSATTPGTRRGDAPTHDARSAQRRWMRLWVPHMQRQWLARVVLPTDDPDDATTTNEMDPADIRARLQGYWADQFQPRHMNERLSIAMARTYIRPADTTGWPSPSPDAIKASLRRARDTAPSTLR